MRKQYTKNLRIVRTDTYEARMYGGPSRTYRIVFDRDDGSLVYYSPKKPKPPAALLEAARDFSKQLTLVQQ